MSRRDGQKKAAGRSQGRGRRSDAASATAAELPEVDAASFGELDLLLETASHVEICVAASALGLPLWVRSDGATSLFQFPEVHISGCSWKQVNGQTGPAGLFRAGNAVHLAMEYASMSFPTALRAVLRAGTEKEVTESRTGFRRRRAYIRLKARSKLTDPPPVLPAAGESSAEKQELLAWLAQLGISQATVKPFLELGMLYKAEARPEAVFAGTCEGKAAGAAVCALAETARMQAAPGTNPLAGWILPGRGSALLAYESPLELLSVLEMQQRQKAEEMPWPEGVRIGLFPDRPQAALAYVFTHGEIKTVHLFFGRNSRSRMLARKLEEELRPFVRVLEAPPPAPSMSWLEAASESS